LNNYIDYKKDQYLPHIYNTGKIFYKHKFLAYDIFGYLSYVIYNCLWSWSL